MQPVIEKLITLKATILYFFTLQSFAARDGKHNSLIDLIIMINDFFLHKTALFFLKTIKTMCLLYCSRKSMIND